MQKKTNATERAGKWMNGVGMVRIHIRWTLSLSKSLSHIYFKFKHTVCVQKDVKCLKSFSEVQIGMKKNMFHKLI